MSNDTMENLFLRTLRNPQVAFAVLTFVLFVTIISLVLFEGAKNSVTLHVNGEELEVKTHAHTVGKLLSEQSIEVAEHDLVVPSVNTPIEDGLSVRWEQSKQVAIQVGEDVQHIWTTETTVQQILEDAKIELSEHDVVTPALQARLGNNQSIEIDKAFLLTLDDGGQKQEVWSTSTTVADFLKRENVQLNEFDRVEGHLDALVLPNSEVKVVRVEKVTDVVEEATKFAVETRKDEDLLKGREKVIQEGKNGKVEREFEIVKENGKEVSRKLLTEKTTVEPTNKVVAVGTKVVVASASNSNRSSGVGVSRSNSSAPSGGKEFYVTATAYTPYCNGCSGISAAGINLRANPSLKVIAVDPRVIPLGTKVWVEGYGYAIAGDTGGAIKGMKIDLLMQTKSEAYNFGRRQVKMKIID